MTGGAKKPPGWALFSPPEGNRNCHSQKTAGPPPAVTLSPRGSTPCIISNLFPDGKMAKHTGRQCVVPNCWRKSVALGSWACLWAAQRLIPSSSWVRIRGPPVYFVDCSVKKASTSWRCPASQWPAGTSARCAAKSEGSLAARLSHDAGQNHRSNRTPGRGPPRQRVSPPTRDGRTHRPERWVGRASSPPRTYQNEGRVSDSGPEQEAELTPIYLVMRTVISFNGSF